MSETPASVRYYDRDAARFGMLYSQPQFEDVHAALLRFLPPLGSRILDLGAGSGRDAFALAERGYCVTAVEPSLGLQAWGKRHYAHDQIDWLDDQLPGLARLRSQRFRFDFILCSAVFMHIPSSDLPESLASIEALLVPGGRVAISVRDRQADDQADIFHNVIDAALIDVAARNHLVLIDQSGSADQLGRSEVRWRVLILQRAMP